jgi:hypothetical protein
MKIALGEAQIKIDLVWELLTHAIYRVNEEYFGANPSIGTFFFEQTNFWALMASS